MNGRESSAIVASDWANRPPQSDVVRIDDAHLREATLVVHRQADCSLEGFSLFVTFLVDWVCSCRRRQCVAHVWCSFSLALRFVVYVSWGTSRVEVMAVSLCHRYHSRCCDGSVLKSFCLTPEIRHSALFEHDWALLPSFIALRRAKKSSSLCGRFLSIPKIAESATTIWKRR